MSKTHITLNRASQWKRALLSGLAIDGHILRGLENSGDIADSAFMISASIDSFEHGHIWDRISFDWDLAPNTSCRVSCYVSDTKIAVPDGESADFDAWLAEGKITETDLRGQQSEHLFSPVKTWNGDGLLGCRGRYLWLRLDIVAQNRAGFSLRAVKLKLPGEQIIDYLPDVYRKGLDGNDFFPRFMAVFDSIFFDMEDSIDRIGEKLDYMTADGNMLTLLAQWLSIGQQTGFGERLRAQIAAAIGQYRMTGTKDGLVCAITDQTGIEPIIVEHFQVEKMVHEGRNRKTYGALFGTNPYKIHIMIPESSLTGIGKLTGLMALIRSCVPANVEFEIVPLQMSIRLDSHTYIGINSCLSDYSSMVLEEENVLYHDVYIGGP